MAQLVQRASGRSRTGHFLALLALGCVSCGAPGAPRSSRQLLPLTSAAPAAPAPIEPIDPGTAGAHADLATASGSARPDAELTQPVSPAQSAPETALTAGSAPNQPPSGRPWLGIEMRQATGAVVLDAVFPNSAAASAGLLTGDRLLSVADASIAVPRDVLAALADRVVGDRIEVRVLRGGRERRVQLQLGAKPDNNALLRSLFVGKPAPSISQLRTVSGAVVPSLTQLRGKVVVLEFWATWCVACRILAPELNRWHAELSAQGVRVLAVTTEPYEHVVNTLPQLDIDYPVFVDESTEVSQAYDASALPTLFIIDQAGVVREVQVGYAPGQLELARKHIHSLLGPS